MDRWLAFALVSACGPAVALAQVAPAERPWTLLVYGAADNDADGHLLEFLNRVRAALDDDPGMELVVWIDRHEGYSDDAETFGADFTGARVYRLKRDSAELLDASADFPGMTADEEYEPDSADPDNIRRFIAFGKQRFPAERTGLLIYGHADGRTLCPDEESGREMSIPELTDLVTEKESVDFMGLELCNMAGIEIAYQWRPGNGGFSADVLVAIPNAGPPLDWERAFERIRSQGHASPSAQPALDPATMSAEDFGKLVIEEGYLGRRLVLERHPDEGERVLYESASCYDLRKASQVKQAVDGLARELARTSAKDVFEELRGPGPAGTVMNYARDAIAEVPYVDLYDLCARAAKCEKLAPEARSAAEVALDAVDRFTLASFGMQGLAGFQPGKNGVFIVFPDGDATAQGPLGKTRRWQLCGWYTPLEAPDEKAPYGRWAFLADGATPGNGVVENWFELLDSWFDDVSRNPAGLNRYRW